MPEAPKPVKNQRIVTVGDLITEMQKHPEDHAVLLYLNKEFLEEFGQGYDYQLWSVGTETDKESGWIGLITIIPDEMVGNG